MSERIVEADKGLFLAADVQPHEYEGLITQLSGIEGLDGVKLGFEVGLGLGLPQAVELTRQVDEDLVVVYDHQKAGNDIPATGMNFARTMENAGVDAAIVFPFNGPVVVDSWVKALQDRDIGVIVGGRMTHEQQAVSEGGYIDDMAFPRIFHTALGLGVRNFVVPGNKVDELVKLKSLLDEELGEGEFDLWAPGFVDQGGDITETGQIAGQRFNAIVGGGIYKAEDPRAAAIELGQKLLALN